MGKGDRKKVRWANKREDKKAERERRKAEEKHRVRKGK